MDIFIVILFGFPAAFASLLVSAIGIHKEKYWLVLIGAVLFIPFSYYLSGSPSLHGFPIILQLFQLVSAAAVREKNRLFAWLLLLPAFLSTLLVVGAVLFYRIK